MKRREFLRVMAVGAAKLLTPKVAELTGAGAAVKLLVPKQCCALLVR